MQEEIPERDSWQECIEGEDVRVRIKMEPKSLSFSVPLKWEINKLKCMLCSAMPRLEFGMIRLEYHGIDVPGHFTLQELLEREREEYMLKNQFVLNFVRGQNRPLQCERYYASKMGPLFNEIKYSPYQPLLHKKYYALHTEMVQMHQLSQQNLKLNLQSLLNIRNLLNLEAGNAEAEGGEGEAGGQGNNNRNIFEWGGLIVFKLFQIVIVWQLIQVVMAYISKEHVFILAGVVIVYFCIDHFQKIRNNQNNQNNPNQPNQNPNPNPQNNQNAQENPNNQENLNQPPNKENQNNNNGKVEVSEQGSKSEEEPNQQEEMKAAQPDPAKMTIVSMLSVMGIIVVVKGMCLLLESCISFVMSLFPNWTIQLHFNMLRDKFNLIDTFLLRLEERSAGEVIRRPEELRNEEEEEELKEDEGMKEEGLKEE